MPDRGHGGPPYRFRPPWWPEDEPFPPASGDWREMRRHFFRRVFVGLVALFLLVIAVGWVAAALFHGGAWGPGRRPFFPGFLVLALVVVGVIAFGRAVRRTTRPIGDVMDAASRLANGDYSARAPVYGPREVRDLATAFNEMAARVEAGERRRRELVADVSHELRTPLSVIQGRIEGVVDGVYPPDREHLELVLDQTRILARLLDDLLLLSKVEAGALALERERVAPRELVDAVVGSYHDEAEERGIALRSHVADDAQDVEVDVIRLHEVFSNLVTNALRHTPKGGTIALAARQSDDGVAFEVADTGPGIAPEELPRVFDRFTKSADSRGSGLGLAIARSLVEAHGGTISVESDASGTRFRFVVPVGAAGQ